MANNLGKKGFVTTYQWGPVNLFLRYTLASSQRLIENDAGRQNIFSQNVS